MQGGESSFKANIEHSQRQRHLKEEKEEGEEEESVMNNKLC